MGVGAWTVDKRNGQINIGDGMFHYILDFLKEDNLEFHMRLKEFHMKRGLEHCKAFSIINNQLEIIRRRIGLDEHIYMSIKKNFPSNYISYNITVLTPEKKARHEYGFTERIALLDFTDNFPGHILAWI